MSGYDYHLPQSLDEAFQLMERIPGARFVAGGTDLMVRIKDRDLRPTALISIRNIPGLSGVEAGDVIRIGASTTIADLMADETLRSRFPLLVEAAGRLGSAQIRNAATVGGNLCNCSPCADTAGPLLVYGARVRLEGPGGGREVPIQEFFQGPGQTCAPPEELLTGVLLDPPVDGVKTAFFKKGRVRMDLAIASLSAMVSLDGETCRLARFAAGSVAPVPLRLSGVEQLVTGQRLDGALLARARQAAEAEVTPISDLRASRGYRRRLVGVYVLRALERFMAGSDA